MTSSVTLSKARIDRLPALKEVPAVRFTKTTCAVIGLGNLGGQAALHLAQLGCRLILVDNGIVEAANLPTQGFRPDDVGRPKVEARVEQIRRFNPRARLTALHEDIHLLGVGQLAHADLLLSCLDSWMARSAVHEMAYELGIPLIDGALDGSGRRFYGRVSTIHPHSSHSACLLCSWDRESFQEARRQQNGVGQSCGPLQLGAPHSQTAPTIMPGCMGAVISGAMVLEGLKLLFTETRKSFRSRELLLDFSSNRFSAAELRRNDQCFFPHQLVPLVRLKESIADMTVADTFALAGKVLRGSPIEIALHRKQLATTLICESGHLHPEVYRVIETFEDAHCHCGAPLFPLPGGILHSFTAEEAQPFRHVTWKDLGLSAGDILSVSNADKMIRYIFAQEESSLS